MATENLLAKNIFYGVASIIGLLIILLLLMEVFDIRLNYRYFEKCDQSRRFAACNFIERRLFVPK